MLGRAPAGDAKPADDFVKDEQRAGALRLGAQGAQERLALQQQSVIGRNWLDDHCGDAVPLTLEQRRHGFDVVQRQDDRLAREGRRHARGRRMPKSHQS